MNNNDLYIKMVLALPDSFFNGWQWKNGDRYVILHPNGQISDDYIADVDCWKFDSDLNIRPLPSQRQLQNIIMQKMNWSPKALLQMFFWWAETNMKRDDFWQFESWDCGWLRYLMDVIYFETWDGEKWL